MARAPDLRIEQAKAMYLNGQKLIEIANQLGLPEGTVRRWKCTHKWDNERSDKKNERSQRKRGAQPGNHNSAGGPPQNKKAEKYGFFSKYLPEETVSIIQEMPKDPLDVLWDQIQIAYAAIIRAQKIMYVRDREDSTKTEIGHKDGDTVTEERWEVQQAWDKQGNFLQAQARAQAELRSMIKQYDELLHKNWDLATEEQRARIAVLKSQVEKDEEKPIQIEFKKAGENHV
ncbi:phage terminase small subunit [Hungatella sp. SL.1.14]|uniref:phage terminase small subunit n=1 Tax=Hungatella sp. SL.1.14 TaxID=2963703 RepID=UPI00210EF5C2|nr:phage terminase small subunit [Hungatella sp. SL.1.14]MCQ4832935.1 phage terminase small subunit [Hungatella sp. SL.1.14]